jgi:hypothetical protein
MEGLQFNGDGTTYGPFGTVNVGSTIVIDVVVEQPNRQSARATAQQQSNPAGITQASEKSKS